MEEANSCSKDMDQHPIFSKDPGQWMALIHKEVLVTAETGRQHQGWVYTIDPVTESIALAQFDGPTKNLQNIEIVLGHAVKEMRVVNENTEEFRDALTNLCKSVSDMPETLSKETLKRRQLSLKSWLEKNRLPVRVSGELDETLTIADVLVVQPPFGPENCICTNEIVLGRIQGLIKNMPADHEQW